MVGILHPTVIVQATDYYGSLRLLWRVVDR